MSNDVVESTDTSGEIPVVDPAGPDDVRESVRDGRFLVCGPQDGQEDPIVPFRAWCEEGVLVDLLHAARLPARAKNGLRSQVDLLTETG
ncbi:hypothetical protein [Cellulomonas soli]